MKYAPTLALVLFLSWIAPLSAADRAASGENAVPDPARAESILTRCPAADPFARLTQVSQSDCCKGHKGVCGCRAGKIVCCDNTTSASCTCHGESVMEN